MGAALSWALGITAITAVPRFNNLCRAGLQKGALAEARLDASATTTEPDKCATNEDHSGSSDGDTRNGAAAELTPSSRVISPGIATKAIGPLCRRCRRRDWTLIRVWLAGAELESGSVGVKQELVLKTPCCVRIDDTNHIPPSARLGGGTRVKCS
jgi:hypothetical protein